MRAKKIPRSYLGGPLHRLSHYIFNLKKRKKPRKRFPLLFGDFQFRQSILPTTQYSFHLDLQLLAVHVVGNLRRPEDGGRNVSPAQIFSDLLADLLFEDHVEFQRVICSSCTFVRRRAFEEKNYLFGWVKVGGLVSLLADDTSVRDEGPESRREQDVINVGAAEADAGRVQDPVPDYTWFISTPSRGA